MKVSDNDPLSVNEPSQNEQWRCVKDITVHCHNDVAVAKGWQTIAVIQILYYILRVNHYETFCTSW